MTLNDQITDMELETARKVRVPSGQYAGRTVADVGRSKLGREWLHNARQVYPVKEGVDLSDKDQLFAIATRVYIVKTE
jgi:hypothetical protein